MTSAPPPIEAAQVQQQLSDARTASKKIRRACLVALSDAWMIAIFAGCSFICGLFGDASSVIVGLAMGIIAWMEFDGAKRLRRLDPAALNRLGFNQLAFAGLIIAYSIWGLFSSKIVSELKSQGADLPPDMEQLIHLIPTLLYGTLIAVAIFAQGGTALYYFTRRPYLQKYIQQTPPWIIEMQRSGGPL